MKVIILILFLTVPGFSQSLEILVNEGESTFIGGNKIEVVSIEYSVSKMFARLLVDSKESIYVAGDELFPGGDSVYFINRIQKTGRRSRGAIVIGNTKDLKPTHVFENIINVTPDTIITVGNCELNISPDLENLRIRFSSTGLMYEILELIPEINDEIWLGTAVYLVNEIQENDNRLNSISLVKLSEAKSGYDLPLKLDEVSDELAQKENLFIRKINYSPTKRPGNEQLVICLIKIEYDMEVEVAMPVIDIEINGETFYYPFRVLRFFDTEEDAVKFAIENEIDNIHLD